MDFYIRKAVTADMYAVHGMVKQLATYEKAPEQVVTTPELYVIDFEANKFDVIVAVSATNEEIIGMALYYEAYSTWKGAYIWLEDFVVDETYRGKGIGKLLFDAVLEVAKQQNCILKWQVLDWNEPAIRFYDKYQAEYLHDWITCRLA
ncbi:MAG: GNAT family N-acetyltransferase [Chitinophagales bacterium]|jgi:GNAT superfamily N-acetyltransferase|nr:GNAT family N-acetyltransferase [Bacteroidota bacterium]